jgi:hypothetical protein
MGIEPISPPTNLRSVPESGILKPIDERAAFWPPVGREALESSSAAFQAAAKLSQLTNPCVFSNKTNEKSPASLGHRAFKLLIDLGLAEHHKRKGSGELPAAGAE